MCAFSMEVYLLVWLSVSSLLACQSVCCACQIINMSPKQQKPQNIMFLTFIVSNSLVHFWSRIQGNGNDLKSNIIFGYYCILIRRKKMHKDKNGKMWMFNIHASVIDSDSMPIHDVFIVVSCRQRSVSRWMF